MSDLFEIELVKGAQSFTVTLGDTAYLFSITYRDAFLGGWFLDVAKQDGSDAVLGIPMLPMIDLFAQFDYKGFGHLYVIVGNGDYRQPTYDDMGTNVRLIWSAEPWNISSGSDTAS